MDKNIRDVTLFISGLLLAFHETFWTDHDRPALLALAGGMMGLAAYFRKNGNGKH